MEGKPRSSPPSTAKVQLLNRLIRAGDEYDPTSPPTSSQVQSETQAQDEYWVCRRSVHADAAVDGSASWDEFRSGLQENHSENEMAYTPSLSGVTTLLEWPVQHEVEGGWRNVDMHGIFSLQRGYLFIGK